MDCLVTGIDLWRSLSTGYDVKAGTHTASLQQIHEDLQAQDVCQSRGTYRLFTANMSAVICRVQR